MRATVAAVVAVFVVGGAAGCLCGGHTEVKDGQYDDGKVAYSVGGPGAGWAELKLPTANAAWHNEALAATLMVNSHCDGVADSPLEGLASDLLMGMTDREILSQARLEHSKREALETVATVKLDGVPRKLVLFVMKKDGCVYDIVLDANPDHFDAARADYTKVRDGFDVAARPDRVGS